MSSYGSAKTSSGSSFLSGGSGSGSGSSSSAVCGCLSNPLFLFGKNTYAIGRHYRTESALSGVATIRTIENDDDWYTVPRSLTGGSGTVAFSTCSISEIDLKFMFDRDGAIGDLSTDVYVNGVLVHTAAPPMRGIQDAEVTENSFNTFFVTLPLTGCENLISISSTSTCTASSMARVLVTAVR